MTRNEPAADRHGSTASSWSSRSSDTIRPFRRGSRGPSVIVKTSKDGGQPYVLPDSPPPAASSRRARLLTRPSRTEKESEISPTTRPPAPPSKDAQRSRKQYPWDDHRKQLAVLDPSGGRGPPSLSRNPSTAGTANPPASNGTNMAHTVWNTFFDDSTEDVSQLSPGLTRPGTGNREDSMGFPMDEDRRPSVASATTVSSTGSKSSVGRSGFHKRLQNVFGEDFPADGRQDSETSLNAPFVADAQSTRGHRNRNNSLNNTIGSNYHSRPASPTNSRPRTPQPSSEVTPWSFRKSRSVLPSPSSDFWRSFSCGIGY